VLVDPATGQPDHKERLLTFDLQSADGANQRLSCLTVSQDDQWHSVLLGRRQGQLAAKVTETPVSLQNGGAPAGMKGYFCFKLRPNEAVEIRHLRLQQAKE
jgi:hypothetical protein